MPGDRVYCAGPLFNQSERDDMTAIAAVLCEAGYTVYLPHRDGFEFRLVHESLVEQGWPEATAGRFLHEAIFAMDVYQLVEECDFVVWNLNGRTPDEGAVSEAAIAWALGKPLVAYKDDVRSLIAGRDNPLLVGLVDFETVDAIGDIPAALEAAIAGCETHPRPSSLPRPVLRAVDRGRELCAALRTHDVHDNDGINNHAIAEIVAQMFATSGESAAERR